MELELYLPALGRATSRKINTTIEEQELMQGNRKRQNKYDKWNLLMENHRGQAAEFQGLFQNHKL